MLELKTIWDESLDIVRAKSNVRPITRDIDRAEATVIHITWYIVRDKTNVRSITRDIVRGKANGEIYRWTSGLYCWIQKLYTIWTEAGGRSSYCLKFEDSTI